MHHQFQGKGIGSVLMNAIEVQAKIKNIQLLYAEVSISAKIFFEKKGFKETKEQTVFIGNISFTNFKMYKSV